jgi:hypothetical protein
MTKARVGDRSDLDMGGVGDRRCDARINMSMEMTTAATPTTAETVGAIML